MNQVQINDKFLLTIKKIGINGEGVGYYKRQTIFVDGALPQEEVEVQIIKALDKYAYAEIIKFKKKSPYRIEPKCKYFGKCGGCQLQHLNYEQSLVEKENLVIDAFNRYFDGSLEKVLIYPTIGMKNPWHYRNKSNLPLRHDGEKVVSGLYHKDTNKLVYIDECLIESKLVFEVVKKVLNVLTEEKVDIYNPKFKHGLVRYLVVRGFEETDEVQVTLVIIKLDKKIEKALKRINDIEKVKSVNYSINADLKAIDILGEEVIHYSGNKEIKGKLNDLKFLISPKAFYQLNTEQTPVLYDCIKQACTLNETLNVVDCYCGIGSIGLYLANSCKEVRGIDINKDGIENAKKFAEINKIKNAKFYYGNIIPHLHDFEKENFKIDVLVVDPPRKGLDLTLINYLKKSKIKKIVYVSCNPSTLAKNLNHLQSEYKIQSIQPIDMFPWTDNVESVVCLERR